MTMTLREVHPTTVSGLALQAWVQGSWPHEKESVRADGTCAVGKVCTCTLLMTVCSCIEHKKHKGMSQTPAVAGTNGILRFCKTDVLDHQSIKRFWMISFLAHLLVPATLRRARCWVRSCCCFPNLLHFGVCIFLWLCVLWFWPHRHHSVSLHWRILLVNFEYFLLCLSLFSDLSSAVIV